MNQVKAMEEIKSSVDPKYHLLIRNYEQNLCDNFAQLGQHQPNGIIRNSGSF